MSCHVRVWEWIHTLQLPECQGTHYLKQARNLNFKWLQLESNPPPLISLTNTQPFSQTDQRIELYCEYLSPCNVRHAFEIVSTLYSCLNVKKLLAQKQAEYLKFKWLKLDSIAEPPNSQTNSQLFSKTVQITELCCEYLSVRYICLYILVMSPMRFKVNAQFIVAWMSRNSLLEVGTKYEVKVAATGL